MRKHIFIEVVLGLPPRTIVLLTMLLNKFLGNVRKGIPAPFSGFVPGLKPLKCGVLTHGDKTRSLTCRTPSFLKRDFRILTQSDSSIASVEAIDVAPRPSAVIRDPKRQAGDDGVKVLGSTG